MITMYQADFGEFQLPDDFPAAVFRLDGWYDRRYKIVADAKAYIAEQSKKLEAGLEPCRFKAPSFQVWRSGNSLK